MNERVADSSALLLNAQFIIFWYTTEVVVLNTLPEKMGVQLAASTAPCRVLYVEDNPADAYILHVALDDSDFELTILSDGEEALGFIESKPFQPDVIVLDLNIPRVDGLTILAALKADPELKSIPVLVFVAPDSPNWKRAALHADLCAPKPFDLDGYRQLRESILRLCQIHTAEALAARG